MVTGPLTKKRTDCYRNTLRLRECLLWIPRTGKEIANLPTVEGMDGVYSMLATNECTFREAAIRASGMFSRISKKMQITTKPSGKSRRGRGRYFLLVAGTEPLLRGRTRS